MADYSGNVTVVNITDVVYDKARDLLHFSTSIGSIFTYDYKARAFTGIINVGGDLSSLAISPDGAFLLAGQGNPVDPNGSLSDGLTGTVHRISLPSGAVENLNFKMSFYESGIADIAIIDNGTAFSTGDFAGSGWVPLRTFAANAYPTTSGVVASQASVRQSTPLIPSETGRYLLLLEPNISNGQCDLYYTETGQVAHNNLYDLGTSGFNTGQGDVSEHAGLVAIAWGSLLFIGDTTLTLRRPSLAPPMGTTSVLSVQFTEAGRQLMLLDPTTDSLRVYDTQTWRPVADIKLANNHDFSALSWTSKPIMDLVDDSHLLLIRTEHGVEIVDLAARLSIHLTAAVTGERLNGSVGADELIGQGGADTLLGHGGADLLIGGAGFDVLDGGEGSDTARYFGAASDFSVVVNGDGSRSVTDLRPGSPEGIDLLRSIETIEFIPSLAPTLENLLLETGNILRLSTLSPAGSSWLSRWQGGSATGAQIVAEMVDAADSTTSVATLTYQFFTGKVPTAAGLDYLVSPTGPNPNNLNSAYYQNFSLENRYINFAVNLGALGEGANAFSHAYGWINLFEATKKAYGEIFGATPSDAKVHALLDPAFLINGQPTTRAQYFAYYGVTDLGTKAAMVGWLLAEAAKGDVGLYARANEGLLTDLADGASLGVDLIGSYGHLEYAFSG